MRLRLLRWSVLLSTLLGVAGSAQAQAPTLAAACEQQITDQFRGLVTDKVLGELPPGLSPPQQLTAIATQLRIITTQYQGKVTQVLQTEANTAALQEVIRQLQQDKARLEGANALLEAELKKSKAPPAEGPAREP